MMPKSSFSNATKSRLPHRWMGVKSLVSARVEARADHHVGLPRENRSDQRGGRCRRIRAVTVDQHVDVSVDGPEHGLEHAALSAAWLLHDVRAGLPRPDHAPIAGSVVEHVDLRVRKRAPERFHDVGDGRLLIGTRDEHGQPDRGWGGGDAHGSCFKVGWLDAIRYLGVGRRRSRSLPWPSRPDGYSVLLSRIPARPAPARRRLHAESPVQSRRRPSTWVPPHARPARPTAQPGRRLHAGHPDPQPLRQLDRRSVRRARARPVLQQPDADHRPAALRRRALDARGRGQGPRRGPRRGEELERQRRPRPAP